MTTENTLRIRCPTWGHLENFYASKVKEDNVLLARVPFSPPVDSKIVIALELPDGLVVDIDAIVEGVRKAPDGKKSAIRMVLQDMAKVRPRLARAVAAGRGDEDDAGPISTKRISVPRTHTGLPVPIPSDVPIDEPVPMVELPRPEDVPLAVRSLYIELEQSLAAMREKAAHDVLGVAWDAEVADIRLAYFGLVKTYHPDVLSKHASEAVSQLGAEIFIYVNKAYDRLRDSAVAAGKAIVAGPALLPHSGWIADFDDIGAARPRVTNRLSDISAPVPVPVKAMSSLAATTPSRDDHVEVNFARPIAAGEARDPEPAPLLQQDAVEAEDLFADARLTQSGMKPIAERFYEGSDHASVYSIDVTESFDEARELLSQGDYDGARQKLAEVLEHKPRDRAARALYHVAYGHTLIERDNRPAAMTQFEVALKHDPKCREAIDAQNKAGPRKRIRRPSLLNRIFKR